MQVLAGVLPAARSLDHGPNRLSHSLTRASFAVAQAAEPATESSSRICVMRRPCRPLLPMHHEIVGPPLGPVRVLCAAGKRCGGIRPIVRR